MASVLATFEGTWLYSRTGLESFDLCLRKVICLPNIRIDRSSMHSKQTPYTGSEPKAMQLFTPHPRGTNVATIKTETAAAIYLTRGRENRHRDKERKNCGRGFHHSGTGYARIKRAREF